MKKNLFFILLSFFSLSIISQPASVQWAYGYGDALASPFYIQSVITDASGNVYSTGYFTGNCDFDSGPATFTMQGGALYNGFVFKTDPNGNFLWAKQIGYTSIVTPNLLSLDNSGDLIVGGAFQNSVDFDPGPVSYSLTSFGSSDIFFLKLSPAGNFINVTQIGGTGADSPYSLSVDPSGNIYYSSSFSNTVDFDPGAGTFTLTSIGSNDIAITKLNSSWSFVWSKQFGGPGIDILRNTVLHISGDIYTGLQFSGPADFDPGPGTYILNASGPYDVAILKLDNNGNLVYVRSISSGTDVQMAKITVDAPGNVYATGNVLDTVDFDPSLSTYTIGTIGSNDAFVWKLDVSGNFSFAKHFGWANGCGIALDAANNIYVAGNFMTTCDIDPGPGTYSLTPYGNWDAYLLKLNNSGSFLWAGQIGGIDYETMIGINILPSGDMFCVGSYSGTCDMDPTAGSYTITSTDDQQYLAKYSITSIGITEHYGDIGHIVFPNPVSNILTVQFSTATDKTVIELYNTLGQILITEKIDAPVHRMDLGNFSQGVYYLKINGSSSSVKIIKN
ncbi:MAG: T9SS type A sorting domain-containing protein [Bacteroidia bacterium]|nr:T9SS type A sorting domain-containing protein [Bacteroidia bacterium]